MPGVSDIRETSSQLLGLITPDFHLTSRTSEQIRVALYRFAPFWKEELQDVVKASFDTANARLAFHDSTFQTKMEIASSDPLIEDALPKLGQTPMLERLRRDRFLFVPGGGRGAERLLAEVYATPGPIDIISTYARLPLITVPRHLLDKHGTIPEAYARYAIMHQRLKEKSLTITEILPEEGFDQLIMHGPKAASAYFPNLSVDELVQHMEFLRELLETGAGYRLILTRSDIPFYLGRYTTQSFSLSSFFKPPRSGPVSAYSCFAIWGAEIGDMAQATLFDWLMNHPTTESDPKKVLKYVENLCFRLKAGKFENTH